VSISCPFCSPNPDRVFLVRPRLLGIWDAYPVTPGHALIIPTRHFPDLSSATAEERQGIWELVDPVMKVIAKQHGPVDGFNIGINGGEAAGQTVPHLHMHIIPRRRGDIADPRGGVRYVIPEKANYLTVKAASAPTGAAPDVVADTAAEGTAPLFDLLTGQVPASPSGDPLVFDVAPPRVDVAAQRAQAASWNEPASADQVRFLTHVQCLLDGGSFSATYKYALLLALADLAVEQGRDDTSELALSTDAIAEKFIEYYWDQCRPFVAQATSTATRAPASASEVAPSADVPLADEAPPPLSPRPSPTPKASKAKAEKVVALLAAVYRQVDGNLPALRADAAAWAKLLKGVRTVVQSTPLWKLQAVADAQIDFLYPSVGRGSMITLRPGITFCLRRFHGLVGSLVRGAWVDWVRNQNRELGGAAADIEDALFGSRRERLRNVAPALYELQKGRCFYTGKELARPEQGDVDHFIPFARYAHDVGHNLVLASKRAMADKCDYLAAEDHLAAWSERNATVGTALADACTVAGISSDVARTLAVARWTYSQADHSETPVWTQGSTLERRLAGRWREILGGAVVIP
jgi:diadenosine tetraphosphate (Ap4A) HIT family hydrolase